VLLELARPVTLLASMISLLAVFHAAFFGPEAAFPQRILDALGMLLIAAGVSLVSGLAFRAEYKVEHRGVDAHAPQSTPRILETFPVQLFCWTTGIMIVLFILAWYLETHCIFYRDIHF
jgi:hypothetical protein